MARNTWDLKQLKNLRLARHWSQEELAESSGLSTRTIQRIERGHKVDIGSVKLLATTFGMDVNELLGSRQLDNSFELDNSNVEFRRKPKKVVLFYLMLLTVIIFVVLRIEMAQLNLTPYFSRNLDIWVSCFISVVAMLLLLSQAAKKCFGTGASRRFVNRILRGNHLSEKPLFHSLSPKKREILDVFINGVLTMVGMFA